MIDLEPLAAYHGPSPVAMDPVVVVDLLLSDAAQTVAVQAIPLLQSATADWYRAPQPQPDDTSPPALRVGEFLADWALQALNFVNGYLHPAGCVTDPTSGRTLVWVGFHDPQISLAALTLGANWLNSLSTGTAETDDWPKHLADLWTRCRHRHPDYQARIVMTAARARGVPYAPAWGLDRLWRFGQGAYSRVLFESSSHDDSRVGSWVSQSKSLTKMTLRSLGIATPESRLVETEAQVEPAVAEVGFPCVTKPLDQGCGHGVSTGLRSLGEVRHGIAAARRYTSGPVLLESHIDGDDHRLVVVEGRLAAVIRREPPRVTGDGRRTIRELVAEENVGRDGRSLVRSGYLRPIKLDASAVLHLAGMGLDPEDILAEGREIRVRSNSNLSTGGDCVDVTDQVHPDLRVLAETIARTMNLTMLGADFLTTDIERSPAAAAGQFIEFNITPALDVMIVAGWSEERAGDLALGQHTARIALRLIVIAADTLDAATAAARERHWPAGSGWAAWDQAANAGVELTIEGGSAWPGVQALLSHRTVDRVVVIATDRQIYEYGLPQDAFAAAYLLCDLDPVWLPVLGKCCADVHRAEPDQLSALLDLPGRP